MFIIEPTTISGKVRLRTPLQADALSGKYIFNNLQNTEPNLGIPKTVTENSPDPGGKRYFLLSNNSYSSSLCSVSAWRVWSYNSPTIATWSKENSIALGDDALPIRQECLVYNNYSQKINRFNSEGFFDNTFNVFSMSGIYLFDPTTIGDPGSATSLIVTSYGNVGVNTDSPNERLSINGNLSCTGTLSANVLYILNNSFLGNSKVDETTVRGGLKLGDMDFTKVSFGSGGIYDTNLYRGGINTLQTDSNFICNNLSATGTISTSDGTSDQWNSNYTTTNSNSGKWESAYTTINASSAATIVAGGNTRGATITIGTNDAFHLRLETNNSAKLTILSSGEVGIGTTLAQTRAQQLTSISNDNFSNTSGMVFNGFDWYGGAIPSWTKPIDGTYDVYYSGGIYVVNLEAGLTGPGSSSCRQSLGALPQLANITCSFTNALKGGTPNTTLSAAIYTDTYTVLASGSFDSVGSYTLTAPNVPANTNIIVGFWGKSGLTNVSVTASNDTIFTTSGSISASSVLTSSKIQVHDGVVILRNLPTSSTGLPSGTVWNNGGVLNII